MGLLAVVEVASFRVRGRLTPWTHISDDHRLLVPPTTGFWSTPRHGFATAPPVRLRAAWQD